MNSEIDYETTDTTLNFLPKTSRKKYETIYSRFIEWQNQNKTNSFSENVMLDYFDTLSKDYKSSSLWTLHSMLRTTISVKNDIDIAHYCKLRAFLKRQSSGYLAKKSKTLSPHEIHKFIEEAPDDQYLLTKVAIIIGITGACRREELCNLKIEDLVESNSSLLVKITDAKTRSPRSFTITGDFYKIYKKYAALRPSNLRENRFFLNYRYGKCTRQAVGINKLGRMALQIASYFKLPNPELYTGHCFRRLSATILVDAQGDMTSKIVDDVDTNLHENLPTKSFTFSENSNMIDEDNGWYEEETKHDPLSVEVVTDDVTDSMQDECKSGESTPNANTAKRKRISGAEETGSSDHIETFVASLGTELRLIKSPTIVRSVKRKIMNLVYEAQENEEKM